MPPAVVLVFALARWRTILLLRVTSCALQIGIIPQFDLGTHEAAPRVGLERLRSPWC
jgi:hypothetical protein